MLAPSPWQQTEAICIPSWSCPLHSSFTAAPSFVFSIVSLPPNYPTVCPPQTLPQSASCVKQHVLYWTVHSSKHALHVGGCVLSSRHPPTQNQMWATQNNELLHARMAYFLHVAGYFVKHSPHCLSCLVGFTHVSSCLFAAPRHFLAALVAFSRSVSYHRLLLPLIPSSLREICSFPSPTLLPPPMPAKPQWSPLDSSCPKQCSSPVGLILRPLASFFNTTLQRGMAFSSAKNTCTW